MAKKLAIIQAVFNLADPYQKKLYEYVVPDGTTNKSDAAKRIFQRDMESNWKIRTESNIGKDNDFMKGLI